MKKHRVFIGVDVSKNKLDVCVFDSDKHIILTQLTVENTNEAIKQLYKQLKKELKLETTEWMFCMEHTGIYSMPFCYFLSGQGLDYALISGLQIHRSLGLKRGKSDKADA